MALLSHIRLLSYYKLSSPGITKNIIFIIFIFIIFISSNIYYVKIFKSFSIYKYIAMLTTAASLSCSLIHNYMGRVGQL